MTGKTNPPPAWRAPFLAAVAELKNVKAACRRVGKCSGTVYSHRKRNAAFAAAWDAALAGGTSVALQGEDHARARYWRAAFFEALAETSNVTASAARVNIPTRTIYKLRREDADFANRVRAALMEGYDHLEMELLGYLRDPKPERKMDVAAALRLLAAHRQTVERERALREEEDPETVRASIDAFLEGMRQRRLANEAILIEAEPCDVAE